MQINLSISGDENDQRMSLNLRKWLNEKSSFNFEILKSEPDEKGHLGIDPVSIISVILGSQAVIILAKALHTWIIATRPKIKIKITQGDKSIEIETTSITDENFLIEKITELI